MRQHGNAALECLQPVRRGHSNYAKEVRETFKDYFDNEGEVSWQARMALLHYYTKHSLAYSYIFNCCS